MHRGRHKAPWSGVPVVAPKGGAQGPQEEPLTKAPSPG
jgi:hypothetical protein